MDAFFKNLPNNPISWVVAIGAVIIAIIYTFSQVRKSDMDVLRNANNDLRNTLTDNEKRISSLETEIKSLMVKVEVLEKRNKTLEDLVITALKQYFFENPKVAGNLKDIINP